MYFAKFQFVERLDAILLVVFTSHIHRLVALSQKILKASLSGFLQLCPQDTIAFIVSINEVEPESGVSKSFAFGVYSAIISTIKHIRLSRRKNT